MKYKTPLIGLGIIAAGFIFGMILKPSLPERMPAHWNAAGEVDRYGSQAEALFLMPAMSLVLLLLLWVVPSISPKGKGVEAFRRQYDATILVICGFMTMIHVAILLNALRTYDVTKLIFAGVSLLFVFIGNLLGKTTRNYWMGIRTPWTLESDAVWEKTHRMAGRWMVGTGLAACAISIVTPWPLAGIALLLIGSFFPVIYSYFVYREVTPGGGKPSST